MPCLQGLWQGEWVPGLTCIKPCAEIFDDAGDGVIFNDLIPKLEDYHISHNLGIGFWTL